MSAVAWVEQGGIKILHMSALEALGGVRAIFTGRIGGVSPRWNGGLNWSYSVGDDAAAVAENKRRTLELIGLAPGRAVMAGLVHGNRVAVVAGAEPPGREAVAVVDECDALVTNQLNLALVVTAADCVPIYFYAPSRRVIGIAHAGWRGTVAGIAGQTVQAMVGEYGCAAADIRAAVGPSIGPCCYEVDDQVAIPLRDFYGAEAERLLAPAPSAGRYLLDLWQANTLDLTRAGVQTVWVSGECTACRTDRYFSHRAEFGTAGRGAAVISLV